MPQLDPGVTTALTAIGALLAGFVANEVKHRKSSGANGPMVVAIRDVEKAIRSEAKDTRRLLGEVLKMTAKLIDRSNREGMGHE